MTIRRRDFITLLGIAAVAPLILWPLVARAQQGDQVRALQIRILHLQAEAAAYAISTFIREMEGQVGWITPWPTLTPAEQRALPSGSPFTIEHTIDQQRSDAQRLLRQVPSVTEIAMLDSSGKEQLRVSRLAFDVVGSQIDYSQHPKFTEAVAHKVYYGPMYLRRESEPYMTLSLAGTRRGGGVSVAEVALKLVWDVILQIKVGERGLAYLVDAEGRLIAHPDISLVLRQTDMTPLAQVQAARAAVAGATAERVEIARDIRGREVLTAYAPVVPLGWLVFVELPVEEAKTLAQ
jgi:hypothetical protein